jgi:hypothetical protein
MIPVKTIQYLQLGAHKPQVHPPDRNNKKVEESSREHQLVWNMKETRLQLQQV